MDKQTESILATCVLGSSAVMAGLSRATPMVLLRLSARLAPLVALVALGRGMRRAQVLHLGVSVSGSAVLGFIAVQFRL